MARRGAVAGLCPITEANLGDGMFPARRCSSAQAARFGIGSDSNVLIGVADELRQLEYSQRLAHRARNVLARPGGLDRARAVRRGACRRRAGARAQDAGGIAAGAPADLVSLDPVASLASGQNGRRHSRRLDLRQARRSTASGCAARSWSTAAAISARDAIANRFRKAMMELAAG